MPLQLPWATPAALSQQPCLRLAPLLKAFYGDSAERDRTMNCSAGRGWSARTSRLWRPGPYSGRKAEGCLPSSEVPTVQAVRASVAQGRAGG